MWVARRQLEALESRLRAMELVVRDIQALDPSKALREATECQATATQLLDRIQAMNARLTKRFREWDRIHDVEQGEEQAEAQPAQAFNGRSKAELRRIARERGMIR